MDELLIKYLHGETTAGETGRVEAWLLADEANRKQYEQVKTAWEISCRVLPPAIPDARQSLVRLKARIRLGEWSAPRPTIRRRLTAWRVAALIAVIACAGIGSWLAFSGHSNNTQSRPDGRGKPASHRGQPLPVMGQYKNQAGNVAYNDTLPDRSVVLLRPHASIVYDSGMQSGERTVGLRGDAFFSVAHNAGSPFVVHVDAIIVRVLGTSFDISHVDGGTAIAVKTGTVQVKKGTDSLVLNAGKSILVPYTGGIVRTVHAPVWQPDTLSTGGNEGRPIPKGRKYRDSINQVNFGRDRETMRSIIKDIMLERTWYDGREVTWFSLTDSVLVVNGRTAPQETFEGFKKRYGVRAGMGYFYGPVKVYGRGIIMSRDDVFGKPDDE